MTPPSRVIGIKTKINKWDLIKLLQKEGNNKQGEKAAFRREKITANQMTDKELISKIYKQLIRFNTRKMNNPIKKWAKVLNRHFSKQDIQMANSVV